MIDRTDDSQVDDRVLSTMLAKVALILCIVSEVGKDNLFDLENPCYRIM